MTKIYAHRGYSSKYPENTMLAFKKAEEAGADGIELDVHFSKDEEIVICHDEDIDRTSNHHGFIVDYPLEELRKYSFYNGMDEYKDFEDIKIPSLEEFLQWFKNTELEVNIELKTNIFRYDGLIDKTIAMVKDFGVEDRVIFSSFNHNSVIKVKNIDSKLKCGFLNSNALADPEEYCKKHGVEYYHISYLGLENDTIQNCHKEDVGLNIWTVDDTRMMEKLIEDKVNGIITNEPEKACKVLRC